MNPPDFLCPSLPEEAIQSIAARTRRAAAFPSAIAYVRRLVGSSRLSFGLGLAVGTLVRFTLLKFLTSFVANPTRRAEIIAGSEAGETSRVAYLIGGAGSRRTEIPFLRYCRHCAREQRRVFGEAYWTRLPLVRGIDYCPKHKTAYSCSSVSRSYPDNLYRLDDVMDLKAHPVDLAPQNAKALIALAQESEKLLNFDAPWALGSLNRAWYALFRGHGIFKTRGATKYLASRLSAIFGDRYLVDRGCDLGRTIECSWLARFLRRPDRETDPLRHLIVLQVLGHKVSDLVERAQASFFLPQVDLALEVCRNPICPEHLKASIRQARTYREKRTGNEIVELTCSACGCTVGRNLDAKDGGVPDKVVHRGQLWDKMLTELWADNSVSLREISRRLHAEPLTIKRHALSQGLHFPRETKRPTRRVPYKARARVLSDEARETWRSTWLKTLKKTGAIKPARKLQPALYARLYRNDRPWLQLVAPPRKPISAKAACGINWKIRDKELFGRVSDAFERIMARRPFQQCTTFALVREMRAERCLKYLDRMPRLQKQLQELAEDRGRYAIRRISAAVDELPPKATLDQVRRVAGLRAETVLIPTVRRFIEEMLGKK